MPDENASGTDTAATETGSEQNDQEHQGQTSVDQAATGTDTEKSGEGSENQTEEEKQAAEEAAERERKTREKRQGSPEWYQRKIAKEADRRRAAEKKATEEREARIRAEERAKVLGEMQKPAGKKEADDDPKPKRPRMADFESAEEYETATDTYEDEIFDWKIRQRDRESKAEVDRKKQEEDAAKRNQTASERQKAFNDRATEILDAIAEEHGEDVAKSIENADDLSFPPDSAMQIATFESEHAPKILKYLFDHKDEAAKIARMGFRQQAVEIDRIERLVTAPPKKTTNAPAPVRPGSGGTSGPTDLSQIKDDKEWYAKKRQLSSA